MSPRSNPRGQRCAIPSRRCNRCHRYCRIGALQPFLFCCRRSKRGLWCNWTHSICDRGACCRTCRRWSKFSVRYRLPPPSSAQWQCRRFRRKYGRCVAFHRWLSRLRQGCPCARTVSARKGRKGRFRPRFCGEQCGCCRTRYSFCHIRFHRYGCLDTRLPRRLPPLQKTDKG